MVNYKTRNPLEMEQYFSWTPTIHLLGCALAWGRPQKTRKHFHIRQWYPVLVAYLLVPKEESFKIFSMHKNFVFPPKK
jgi:hypothetical protein